MAPSPESSSRAPLFERDGPLRILAAAQDRAARGHGGVVAIIGDAGLGKTALVNAFCRRQRNVQVLRGLCDALSTPRPLGAIRDIARTAGGMLEKSFAAGRDAVFDALLTVVSVERPTLVVLEDLHWADEATLDLVRFLGRRIGDRRCLLVVTARRQELVTRQSLARILGTLPAGTVERIDLAPLTPEAVDAWAVSMQRSSDGLHAMTGGNPFFVAELLHAKGATLPGSIRDALLDSATALSPAARAVLDQCAVIPGALDAWLVEALWPGEIPAVSECLDAGLLVQAGAMTEFKHELARRALLDVLAPGQARRYHERVLECLLAHQPDQYLGRVVHHAAAAGRAELVTRFGEEAAREAASVGAHREAAAHYARTLEYGSLLPEERRAELCEALAFELYLTGQIADAQRMRERALELRLRLGDGLRIGENTRWLARIAWTSGDQSQAIALAERAIERLCQETHGPELANAFSIRSQIAMCASQLSDTIEYGTRAVELARRLGDLAVVSHALNSMGAARVLAGDAAGWAELEESLAIAMQHNLIEHAARAWGNLASCLVTTRQHARASEILDQGITYCDRLDLDLPGLYKRARRAQSLLDRGEWSEAQAAARALLEMPDLPTITRIPALTVAARVQIRNGQRAGLDLLEQASALARDTGELQRLGPIAAAAAEAVWLDLAPAEFGVPRPEVLAAARHCDDVWLIDELAFWTWRAFGTPAVEPRNATPFARHLRGDAAGAAAEWASLGCPYERAIALLDVKGADAQRDALELVEALGATPLIQRVRRLARVGKSDERRPEKPAAGGNGGLTPRQHEVLMLLAEGLTNEAIGRRLFLSPKTVGHHIEAILARLEAKSRTEAVFIARKQGVLGG